MSLAIFGTIVAIAPIIGAIWWDRYREKVQQNN